MRAWVKRGGIVASAVVATGLSAAGVVLASGSGFPGAPQSQHFGFGSTCPAAPANQYLPHGVGCVTVRLADVDGDGKPDLVLLYTHANVKNFNYRFTLAVVRAAGGTVTIRVPDSDIPATINRLRNVNQSSGAEVFVHESHISTDETMGVYTFDGHRLRRAGAFLYGGSDSGIKFGFTCTPGTHATIVQHEFTFSSGLWHRQTTDSTWVGSSLNRSNMGSIETIFSKPPPSQVGVHC
jgi:hypothetical protein